MLFSASLEAHMKAYMDQVKLEEINIEYQKMENQIIQDGIRMQMNQADILNKVEQMKKELIDSIINKKISIKETNAPRQKKFIPNEDYGATGQLLEDFPIVAPKIKRPSREETVNNILNLYKDKPITTQRDALLSEIINAVNNKNNKNKNKKMTEKQLNNEFERNLKEVIKNPKINEALHDELQRSLQNIKLRKTPPREIKERKIPPIEREIKEEINRRLAPVSSQATTASTTSELEPPKESGKELHLATKKSNLVNRLREAHIPIPIELQKRGTVSDYVLNKIESELIESGKLKGSGLKYKKKKQKK